MNYSNNFNNLEDSIKQCRQITSEQLDEKILSEAGQALEQNIKVSRKNRRRILGNIIKLTAAAATIIVAFIFIEQYLIETTETKKTQETVVKQSGEQQEGLIDVPQQTDQPPATTVPDGEQGEPYTEITNIMDMFAGNDVEGLVELLSDSPREIKLTSAIYLMRIGDEQAADVLQKLSTETDDAELADIFSYAASLINRRLLDSQKTEIITVDGRSLYLAGGFVPKGVLSGRIADAETGEPVSGINITIEGQNFLQTTTDANGFYSFAEVGSSGRYKIEIRSKEYLTVDDENLTEVILQNDSNMVRHFALTPACTINITVANESNEPVEGAYVYESGSIVYDENYNAQHLYGSAESTDANGLVTLGGFKPSGVVPKIFNTKHSSYAPGQLVVTLNDYKDAPDAKIVLDKGLDINGYAEYSDGIAAENVTIKATFYGNQQIYTSTATTDENGLFTLPHISAGQYSIEASIPDPQNPMRTSKEYCMTTQLPPEDNFLNMTISKKSPQNLAAISGTVTCEGDIDRVQITASTEDGRAAHIHIPDKDYNADSNDPNSFIIYDLEPGTYTLEFSGLNIKDKIIENVTAPTSGLVVQLEPSEPPLVSALVLNAETVEPIKDFDYRLKLTQKHKETGIIPDDKWHKATDSNGLITKSVPAEGIYQMQVLADGFAAAWSEEIDTDTGKPALIILFKGGTIKGTVFDSMGEPVSGAKAAPLSTTPDTYKPAETGNSIYEKRITETDELGEFTIENLPEGMETLMVSCPSYIDYVTEPIEVKKGQVTGGVEIVLQTGGIVEGFVYDADGRKQANARLAFCTSPKPGAPASATTITDSNGFYGIDGLSRQLYFVQRDILPYSEFGVQTRTIVPRPGQISRLDFGGEHSISGRLVLHGRPMAGKQLVLTEPDVHRPDYIGFTCSSLTDAQGRFEFTGVPAGVYSIYCRTPQDIFIWLKTAILRMGAEDIDLGTVPKQFCSIEVFAAANANDPNLKVSSVYAYEGTELPIARAGNIIIPDEANQPYIINDILPGSYLVYVERSDTVTFRIPIIVTDEIHHLTFELPAATGAVSGVFIGEGKRQAALFSEGKKVWASIEADEDGGFRVSNLPAGRYFVSANRVFPMEQTAIMEFALAEGGEKILEIDTEAPLLMPAATLRTVVINENGVPISGADVWLEGYSEIVEPLQNDVLGQFFITQPGAYNLHAVYDGYEEKTQNITLEAADKIESDMENVLFIKLERAGLQTE